MIKGRREISVRTTRTRDDRGFAAEKKFMAGTGGRRESKETTSLDVVARPSRASNIEHRRTEVLTRSVLAYLRVSSRFLGRVITGRARRRRRRRKRGRKKRRNAAREEEKRRGGEDGEAIIIRSANRARPRGRVLTGALISAPEKEHRRRRRAPNGEQEAKRPR